MVDVAVPFEQEGTKAIVRSWLKQVGDHVEVDDPLVELETDKVTQEVPSPAAGVLLEIILNTDAEAVPGALLGRIGSPAPLDLSEKRLETESALAISSETELAGKRGATSTTWLPGLSPSVRRAIKKHGLNPVEIEGSGRGGRITRADVDRTLSARIDAPAAARGPESSEKLGATVPEWCEGVRTIHHDRMRLAIAENMLKSVTVAPHVTAVFEADFSAIIAHRRKHKARFEKDGASLTFTAYLVAACVTAMKVAPIINSRWFDDRLEVYDDINIGVGTALGDKGLIVPVVQRAQNLSLLGIATQLGELIGRARANKLAPGDVRGGTFTISNHGVSGSLFAAPIIIAQPQSAILGVGKVEKRVLVREIDGVDTIQIRPMCFVSLTIDHRVVDGHQTNLWLARLVETLEGWPLDG